MATITSNFSGYDIRCIQDGPSISLRIDTEDLRLRSIEKKDTNHCIALGSSPAVYTGFTPPYGCPPEELAEDMSGSIANWQKSDPYSTLVVLNKKNNAFLGTVCLEGDIDFPGEVMVSLALHPRYWNQGIGRKIAKIVTEAFAPFCREQGYLVNGKPFTQLFALVSPDPSKDRAVKKILQGVGAEKFQEEIFVGECRFEKYQLSITQAGAR